MKKNPALLIAFILITIQLSAQSGWTVCNTPAFSNRVDDIFMVNPQIGYAVSGDGSIVKTSDGGNNWVLIRHDTGIYCRSVEFINTQKGFAGGFPTLNPAANILRKTSDGGTSWTDLTPLLDVRARKGICGLCIPDSNTIYGCGNFFSDSAYIVKSADGGNTWSFIDMHTYATHLIDMCFINKDTGFVTGSGLLPAQTAVILCTTDGGQTWAYKFQNTINSEYCWKIQRLTPDIYFASIEEMTNAAQRVLKSTDGGMTWNVLLVPFNPSGNGIEGIGFIDSLKGWTGGGYTYSYESNNGGVSWDTIPVCPAMNRVFKVNDTLLFACGTEIWKYHTSSTGTSNSRFKVAEYASLNCYPNPASKNVTIDVSLSIATHALIIVLDSEGNRLKLLDNTMKAKGDYQYQFNTEKLKDGMYFIVLKTHEDNQTVKIIVHH